MEVSNKTIAFMLLLAIIVSTSGTLYSLNRLRSLSPTGLVSYGYTNISIAGTSSIAMLDTGIDFGSCTPSASGWLNVSSNETSVSVCDYNAVSPPDRIRLKNDGNLYVNVTMQSSVIASTFIGGSEPGFYYDTNNSPINPGCGNTGMLNKCTELGNCTTATWTNITSTSDTTYKVCGNLTYGSTSNEVDLYILVQIPYDAPADAAVSSATLTFTGSTIT